MALALTIYTIVTRFSQPVHSHDLFDSVDKSWLTSPTFLQEFYAVDWHLAVVGQTAEAQSKLSQDLVADLGSKAETEI